MNGSPRRSEALLRLRMTQWSTLAPEGCDPARKLVSLSGAVQILRGILYATTRYLKLLKSRTERLPGLKSACRVMFSRIDGSLTPLYGV